MDSTAALPIADGPLDAGMVGRATKRLAQPDRVQESALVVLSVISSYLDADEDLPSFFGRLCASIAEQTHASRAAFWRLGARGTLSLQTNPHGFDDDSPIYGVRFQLGAKGHGVLERVIFDDDINLARGTCHELDALWRECGLKEIRRSVAVPWRSGERRIGAITVFDSSGGFTAQDVWLLRLTGMAAGLLWQYREAEDELGHTAERLEEAAAARRNLLNNVAAGGDEARRRFASALHDDSLQLLTGAELQIERIAADLGGEQLEQVTQLKQTLLKVEDSLRRLLINVSPEPLQMPGSLSDAISERLAQLRMSAGIQGLIETQLSHQLPPAIHAIVLKNISEALNNVEKHARATRVTVMAEEKDDGIRVEISDDGTGFVVAESVQVPGHIGLVALRERAQLAGGWCRISSEPGTGTTVEFWVPMTL